MKTMNAQPAPLTSEIIALLRNVTILASLTDERMHCLDGAEQYHLDPDQTLIKQGETVKKFCILLSGHLRLSQKVPEGGEQTIYVVESGGSFGEVPLLANIPSTATVRAADACELLILDEERFWNLMTECPEVRQAILANMANRLAKAQSTAFQQEKMASLGTLAAGLMHELNNPGAAARRASAQLRENLLRMHQLTAKFSRTHMDDAQKECMFDLQEYALSAKPDNTLSSLDQSDREDTLTAWMEDAQVEDAWKLAPTLVSVGIDAEHLSCARTTFNGPIFSDALSWLEALVSSMQLVGTIEESIGRVTDLVMAVKMYAYEGRGPAQQIDVNKSIYATLVILGHKLREKQIALNKSLSPDLPKLTTNTQGLNQVWTNLIDNAIDASAQNGQITLKTWSETLTIGEGADQKQRTDLCILVGDQGTGIPLECQAQIFNPFFTTKPVGVGTGLGLGIVYRIVEQSGGSVRFSSNPGETEFLVRLPTS